MYFLILSLHFHSFYQISSVRNKVEYKIAIYVMLVQTFMFYVSVEAQFW